MKLIQINTVCNESTGRIMLAIQRAADAEGFDTLSVYGRRKPPAEPLRTKKAGDGVSFWSHVALTTAFDLHGRGSVFETKRMIRILREEKPDIIHLHNIHGYYLNYPILFRYLKNEFQGRVFWTLHDCWTYTGHCAHYVNAGCDKWKTGCSHCPNKSRYPVSLFLDNSRGNYSSKKENFTGIRDMTILVPSQWLFDQVKQSFLKDYRTLVVPNGVNTEPFLRTEGLERLWEETAVKYGIPADKKILLSVASHWDKGKGTELFDPLADLLPDDYCIVLVGAGIRKEQFRNQRIRVVGRTENVRELSAIYHYAHLYLNASVQETFSLVTIEAMACGLPVIALDTSAVKELVPDSCGVVLHDPAPSDFISAICQAEERMRMGTITKETLKRQAGRYTVRQQTDRIIALYKE